MISLVLGSDSVSDIRQIKDRGFWTHTCSATVKVGDLIAIKPTTRALEANEGTTCVIAKVKSKPSIVTPQVWSSTTSDEEEYIFQIDLEDIQEVLFRDLPPYVRNAGLSRRGLRYLKPYIVFTNRKKSAIRKYWVLKLENDNYVFHSDWETKVDQQIALRALNNRG